MPSSKETKSRKRPPWFRSSTANLQPDRGSRILATIQTYSEVDKTFSRAKILHQTPIHKSSSVEDPINPIEIRLQRGGTIRLFPQAVPTEMTQSVHDELLTTGSSFFRTYRFQGMEEPRTHFLLHADATDDFEQDQPGYSYVTIKMKARPLASLPLVQDLSYHIGKLVGVEKWTVGVNPVLYRDGQDRMGAHADNDQGEQLIAAAIISAPPQIRLVQVTIPKQEVLREGDERITLSFLPGDVYTMDGEMQKNYVHSIPREHATQMTAPEKGVRYTKHRLVIVLRVGEQKTFTTDSGDQCDALFPDRTSSGYKFGRIEGICEGHVYTRRELLDSGAHGAAQRGVSGTEDKGCDAIIVSGNGRGSMDTDQWKALVYAAEAHRGGRALRTSFKSRLPVRVFRSHVYRSPYVAIRHGKWQANVKNYRYDGLYLLIKCEEAVNLNEPFVFHLRRSEEENVIPTRDLLKLCQELGTLLPDSARSFLKWWDKKQDQLEGMAQDRDAMYGMLELGPHIEFLTPNARRIAHAFKRAGLKGAEDRFKDIVKKETELKATS
eukprot:Nitzschia sp. Nitz4//scaffold75_size92586//56569//58519//NITZ4_004860-RA/size92586-augustus-gene-0.90-mRNA-1//-1//CDS//3329557720//267//frame0